MKKKLLLGTITFMACLSLGALLGCNRNENGKDNVNSEVQNVESVNSACVDKEIYTFSTTSNTDEYGKAGEYTVYNNQELNVGEKVMLTVTVNEGYNFVGWYIGDVCISADLEYTYTMRAENVVLEAVYNYYTVSTFCETDEYGLAGNYTEYEAEKVSVGEEITVVASVNDGYNFVGWYLADEKGNTVRCVSEELSYTFIMEEENLFLKAEYSYYTLTTYSETDEYGLAGSYTSYTESKTSIGKETLVTATVNEGYNFSGWYIENICVSEDLQYRFVMKAKNVEIEARYSYYTVSTWSNTDDYGMAGSYTAHNNEKVSLGETVTLTATVEKGYNFEGWYINKIRVTTDFTYTFTMSDNISVEARYSYYTLTTGIGIGSNGFAYTIMTVEWSEGFTYYKNKKISVGEEVTLKVAEQNGYKFKGWYTSGYNSMRVSTELEFTFVMKEQNINYVAIFEKN